MVERVKRGDDRNSINNSLRLSRMLAMALLLLTLSAIACKTTADPKNLVGVWTRSKTNTTGMGATFLSLTFLEDGAFFRELQQDIGTGVMQPVLQEKGTWQSKDGTLIIKTDRQIASEEYRWEVKDLQGPVRGKELRLKASGDSQPSAYVKM